MLKWLLFGLLLFLGMSLFLASLNTTTAASPLDSQISTLDSLLNPSWHNLGGFASSVGKVASFSYPAVFGPMGEVGTILQGLFHILAILFGLVVFVGLPYSVLIRGNPIS